MISFAVSKEDADTIRKIVMRAATLAPDIDRMSLIMDLTATHAATPLELDRLLAFDDADFGHDVFGIRRFIDRENGRLTRCFLPRCSTKE